MPPVSRSGARRRRIALIATGGTIDAIGDSRLDLAWYNSSRSRLPDGGLIARVPEIDALAEVVSLSFRRRPSHAITTKDWQELRAAVRKALEGGVDGVVISHGTNTLEETAFFLHLTVNSRLPIVLVGAMRPSSALSADGDLNLLNAIRVAAAPYSAGLGVLVVMNDAIYSARDVTKGSTYRVSAFEGRELGPLGFSDVDGEVVYYHTGTRLHTTASEFARRRLPVLPRTDVSISYVGADGSAIDALIRAGAKGIVSASTGAGYPTPAELDSLVRAHAAGVTVCIASRVGSGRVLNGGHIAENGFIAAGNLSPWKARILLALGLSITQDRIKLQRIFDHY